MIQGSTRNYETGRAAGGRRLRRWLGGTTAVLALAVVLAIPLWPRQAEACSIFNPVCWVETALDAIKERLELVADLVVNVVTLDPEGLFDDVVGELDSLICDVGSLPILSIVVSNITEEVFDACDPGHPIEPEVLAYLDNYFNSDFSEVTIYENCGDLGSRVAITFGEQIYFQPGAADVLNPSCPKGSCNCRIIDEECENDPNTIVCTGLNNYNFAVLAHELIHTLQYRREGFADFGCMYAADCLAYSFVAGTQGISCDIEQEGFLFMALVYEDMRRDGDGIFTCPLGECDDEIGELNPANFTEHECGAEIALCGLNSDDPDRPDYCNANDNCPNAFNRDQADDDLDGRGDACDTCDLDLKPFEDLDNDCVLDTADNCVCPPDDVARLADCDKSNDPPLTGFCVPGFDCSVFANTDQADLDTDGLGDVCDPDDDGDGVDDDVDNCPLIPNPGQENLDGDALGDICDDQDGLIEILNLRVRQNTSTRRPDGRITLSANVIEGSPDDTVDPSGGIRIRVTDGGVLDETFEWTADDCSVRADGEVHCTDDGPATLNYQPLSGTPGVGRLRVRLTQRAIPPPTLSTVMLELVHSPAEPVTGIDRAGTIDTCEQTGHGVLCEAP